MTNKEKLQVLAGLPRPSADSKECYSAANSDRGLSRHFWTVEGDTVRVVTFWIEGNEIKSAVKTRAATDADR